MKKQVSPVVAVIVILVVVVIVALLWNYLSSTATVESMRPEKGLRRSPPSAADVAKYAGQSEQLKEQAQKDMAAANEREAARQKAAAITPKEAGGE